MNTHGPWHHMDETERRKWQDPEAILLDIGVKPGMTLIDIGCGEGFFALPAARLTGRQGKVYGLDTDVTSIKEIRRKASAEGLENLELKAGPAEETLLCQACADIVFFGIVLHDFRDPARVLEKARKMIKPDGRLVNLDWKKQSHSFGPPVSIRFDEETARRMIESAGFKVESVTDSGKYHYLILARPQQKNSGAA
jgi:ubiquinone/menaquinone biosynthesis C-methylase UbiE